MAAKWLWMVSAVLSTFCSSLPTISQKGRYFFTSDGNRFFVKGIAYQLFSTGPYTDPLVNTDQCTKDATLMQKLGANAIRVYHVRSMLDHTDCMNIFNDHGIYIFVDLDDYSTELSQVNPGWTNAQKLSFQAVMDSFAHFPNTAGFFIGNEVITSGGTTGVATDIKAAVRDMKAYMKQQGYRQIPIGYSHADVQSVGQNLQTYFACGDEDSMLDFYGLNSYRWCGNQTFQGSGYIDIYHQTQDYPIPLVMSETGCIEPEPRLFQDQDSILGPDMDDVWSGAIIYEWLQEENHYGLVTYDGGNTNGLSFDPPPGGWPRSGTPTPVTPDFDNLSQRWKTISPTGTVSESDYTPTLSPLACPPYQEGAWQVSGDAPLPTASGSSTLILTTDRAPAPAPTNAPAPATTTSAGPDPTPIGPKSGPSPTGFPSSVSITGSLLMLETAPAPTATSGPAGATRSSATSSTSSSAEAIHRFEMAYALLTVALGMSFFA